MTITDIKKKKQTILMPGEYCILPKNFTTNPHELVETNKIKMQLAFQASLLYFLLVSIYIRASLFPTGLQIFVS